MAESSGKALALRAAAIETLDAVSAGIEEPLGDIARLRGVHEDEVIAEIVRMALAPSSTGYLH